MLVLSLIRHDVRKTGGTGDDKSESLRSDNIEDVRKANDIYTQIVADSNLIFGGSPLRRYREYVCYDSHFCNAILATKMERVVDRYATCPHHS